MFIKYVYNTIIVYLCVQLMEHLCLITSLDFSATSEDGQ